MLGGPTENFKMKTYTGVLTKSTSLPGRKCNYEVGYKVHGVFTNPPELGRPFHLTPTEGEFAGGWFHTSNVMELMGSQKVDTKTYLTLKTENSTYRLTYWEISL